MRWLLWFVLVPQLFLLAGWLGQSGWPWLDLGAVLCLYLALFARAGALPGLLLGAAVGRAVVDEASVAVQVLVLGIPVAALLPLRPLFYRNHLWWQVAATALFAIMVPKLCGLCGDWFDQPSASSALHWWRVAGTAGLGPLLLLPLRHLPPMAAFVEPAR